jgi:nucleotide-binding universal stress UspA family protein
MHVDVCGGATLRSILVPLDGSDFSEHALGAAASLARAASAHVRLIHVHQPLPLEPGVTHNTHDDPEIFLRGYIGVHGERLRGDGIDVSYGVLTGPVAPTIAAMADEWQTDLIVMTTHGRGGLARTWLGSTADELLRKTRIPLLLLRPSGDKHEPLAPERVVIALDGSRRAEAIVPCAIGLARLTGARATLFTAMPHRDPEPPARAAAARSQAALTSEAEADSYLHELARRLSDQEVPVDIEVREHESPAKAILEALRPADVVAIATHGRGGLSRLILGSVADQVLRGTAVPMLVLRPA